MFFDEFQLPLIHEINIISWFIALEEGSIQLGYRDVVISEFHIFNEPPQPLHVEPSKHLFVDTTNNTLIPVSQLTILPQQQVIDTIINQIILEIHIPRIIILRWLIIL